MRSQGCECARIEGTLPGAGQSGPTEAARNAGQDAALHLRVRSPLNAVLAKLLVRCRGAQG